MATKDGDEIASFAGGDVLYVIRRTTPDAAVPDESGAEVETLPTWTLIGEAYVHGLMDGEVWMNGQTSASQIILV